LFWINCVIFNSLDQSECCQNKAFSVFTGNLPKSAIRPPDCGLPFYDGTHHQDTSVVSHFREIFPPQRREQIEIKNQLQRAEMRGETAMTVQSRLRKLVSYHLSQSRKGNIVVLAAALMVVILAFTAFTVDLGYIALTRTQLQAAADGSALGAGLELVKGFGPTASSAGYVQSEGSSAAQAVAFVHKNGDLDSTYLNPLRDVQFGSLSWNGTSHTWRENWGTAPYNLVEVNIMRGYDDTYDTFLVSGDTGIDANLENELNSIIGQERVVPLFTTVVNPGTGATYTIVKWVGIRIMAVDLRGNASTRSVIIQPSSFVASGMFRVSEGGPLAEINEDTVFAPLFLYK
jgi:hypothetical protein